MSTPRYWTAQGQDRGGIGHGETEENSECIQEYITEIPMSKGHSFRTHIHVYSTVMNERLSVHVIGRTADAGRADLRVPPLTMDFMEECRP